LRDDKPSGDQVARRRPDLIYPQRRPEQSCPEFERENERCPGLLRHCLGSDVYPLQDTRARPGFHVYLLVVCGFRLEATNSEPHRGNYGVGCSPNRPASCLVNRCPDCSPNCFPGCYPGCGSSRCPRCSLHRSTPCSTSHSDHCGLSRRPHCSPRSSDRCSPGCSENSFLSCPPSRSIHCLPDCRASNVPGRMSEHKATPSDPRNSVRRAQSAAGSITG
jgi:hypothetical protein